MRKNNFLSSLAQSACLCVVLFINVSLSAQCSIVNQTVSAAQSSICSGASGQVQMASSQAGVTYKLRNDANDAVVGSAVTGTGSALTFNTGALTATTAFNVYAEYASYGIQFDGSNDNIVINNPVNTASFTLEAWIKTSVASWTGTNAFEGSGLLYADVGGGANDYTFALVNNKLSFFDGGNNVNVSGTTNLNDGNWHHVAVIRTAGVKNRLYVDGVFQSEANASSAILNARAQMVIGGNTGDNRYFNGTMDEVRVWNYAMDPTVMAANLYTCYSGTETGLNALFKFENGPNSATATNSIGSNNGTLVNTNNATVWTSGTNICAGCNLEMSNVVTINVGSVPAAPTGTAAQTFCTGQTVSSLVAIGTSIQWYAASSGGSALSGSTTLVNNTTYYASQTVNGCESTSRFAVVATVGAAPSAPGQSATGGNITTSGGYKIHTFTSSGTFVVPAGMSGVNAEVLVVAGGGGGGNRHAGGGGAGGVVYNNAFALTAGQSYTVTVGAGGTGANSGMARGNNGGNSVFSTITATGGGGGGSNNQVGGAGGSGGGGSNGTNGGNGTAGQGNKGGNQNNGAGCCHAWGCGGGGAGAAGANSTGSTGSAGGVGVQYSISGSPVFYAGGGGGGNGSVATVLAGGSGGGGNGGSNNTLPTAGAANTGGGGGGGGANGVSSEAGAAGGSGVVIIRYLDSGSASLNQTFCGPTTVANLTMTGSNIKWYTVSTGGTPLLSTATVTTGTYYASQTVGTCESARTTVNVTVNTPITYYLDADNDGYYVSTTIACSSPGASYRTTGSTLGDCNDNNASVFGAAETCNGLDDDCDGTVDEGVKTTYYSDSDGDGFGNLSVTQLACTTPVGYVSNSIDCNDASAAIKPTAVEVCDGVDNNCDGTADNGLTFVNYYVDTDGDGYGAGAASNLCSNPGAGYVTNNTDCNDANATLNSITTEVCNNFDDDCDGTADDGLTFVDYYVDTDGDGYGAGTASNLCSNPGAGYVTNNTDCNDANATLISITTEVCNNFDDDCDGTEDNGLTFVNYYVDTDGDGYGAGAASNLCSNPGAGYVTNNTDCNDANTTLNSITTEVCNNFDDDCDGTADDGLTFVDYYVDTDGDGYGAGTASNLCSNPGAGYVTNNSDCNDADATLNSITTEVCNDFDDDCDGVADDGLTFVNYYLDSDGDGYGTLNAPGIGIAGSLLTDLQYYLPLDGNFNDAGPNNIEVNNEGGVGFTTDRFGVVSKAGDFQSDQRLMSLLDVSESAFAVSFFFKTDNPNAGFFAVGGGGHDRHVHLNNGNIRVRLWANEVLESSGLNLSDNQWHHVVYQYQQDVEVQKVYVDGALVLAGTHTYSDFNWQDRVHIGYSEDTGFLNGGSMDDVAIWTRILTIPEIQSLYSSTNVVADYPVNACVDPGVNYVTNSSDCADNSASINPNAVEVCNIIDDDCDGEVDEFVTTTFYADADGDGFGNLNVTTEACTAPANFISDSTDCDDETVTYQDGDNDGYGSTAVVACGVANNTDCNDTDATLNSITAELCNNFDDNCDGQIDEGVQNVYYLDADNDGYGHALVTETLASGSYITYLNDGLVLAGTPNYYYGVSCVAQFVAPTTQVYTFNWAYAINDDPDQDPAYYFINGQGYQLSDENGALYQTGNVSVSVNAGDVFGFGINSADDEAGPVWLAITDFSAYSNFGISLSCSQPAGYSALNTDCNDDDATLNSITTEVCNNFDDDCDGEMDEYVTTTYYQDLDGDGFGNLNVTTEACTAPANFILDNTDCDDAVVTYQDGDNDGYGNALAVACGVANNTDCNDADATVHSITTEVCNNFDDDCDGTADDGLTFVNYYVDTDGDGYGAGAASNLCSNPGAGYVTNNTDCNNNNAAVHTITNEVCNNFDDDCDGTADDGLTFVNYYVDTDGDGYGAGAASNLCSNPGAGYVTNNTDCNNNNAAVHTITTEVCNNFDDDCDGTADDGLTFVNYYVDADGDGYGAGAASNLCSNPGAGYVTNNTDCNNNNATVHAITTEVCNNFDDDCDGTADDGLTFVNYYVDTDGDGYGAGAASNLCSNPGAGYVTNNTDCNNNNAAVHAITTEVCNNFDDDCDGTADDELTFVNYYVDTDGDGYGAGAASNSCSNPGAGYVTNNTDCNDADASLNAITTEVCNNFDDDCNGVVDNDLIFIDYYVDADGDGYGAGAASNLCSDPGAGYVTNNTDCNDADATLNSITTEVCNNFDDDCNGVVDNDLIFVDYFVDADGDGYGAGAASNLCSDPGAGYVTNNTDCNDADAALNAITTEVCNNFDDDCNGVVDNDLIFVDYFVDADGDGYGAGAASNLCSDPGAGYVTNNTDCNDADATLNAITTEVCNNFDDDCNGVVDNDLIFVDYYVDADGDGYGTGASSNLCSDPGAGYVTNNTDCNDADAALNSITTEVCNNFDDDCNGVVDNDLIFVDYYVDADVDGYGVGSAINLCADPGLGYSTNNTDCDDNVSTTYPGATEFCNEVDDDCNGVVDNDIVFTDYYADNDGDGFGSGIATSSCHDLGEGFTTDNSDCNDTDGSIFPTATEVCNLIDDNCDGEADEFVTTSYFADNDGDGFGFADNAIQSCEQPQGFVANSDDCDDSAITYEDLDGDGYGNVNIVACGVLTSDDCDETSASINPGANEVCDNGTDDNCDGEETTCIFLGCIDVAACNFNATANTDDGSCTYPAQSYLNCDGTCINDTDADGVCNEIEVAGCTDATACNYDSDATDENGSCTYPAQSYLNCDGTCINDTDADGVCNEIEVAGCTDATACNYDSNATDENGSCTYPAQSYLNCNGTCINDTDADGVCNEIEVAGCTDVTACNYNVNATDENGSCTYPAQSYLNCNGTCINDTDADGVCNEIEVAGCTDVTACNYNVNATDENGSCTYPAQSYLNCNGTCINDTDADGVCNEIEVAGCTDVTACNYNVNATDENGSCTYPAQSYLNCNGTCINDTDADGVCNEIEVVGCTDATACNYIVNATEEDGTCTYPAQSYLNCNGTCINDTDADGVCNEIEVAGCTDATACNYEASATDNDGSCILPVAEICNTLDDDCDGEVDEFVTTTYYADLDQDGFGDVSNTIASCSVPNGFTTDTSDCDDSAMTYLDLDGDGFGINQIVACGVILNTDCDDTNSSIYPGVNEQCNLIDDNCDGITDNNVVYVNYYADADSDGFGNSGLSVLACVQPVGYINNNDDCNDADSLINPNAIEIEGNDIDENCDGELVGLLEMTEFSVSVYPNPTIGNVQLNWERNQDVTIRVLDAQGRLVFSEVLYQSKSTNINFEGFESGMYIVQWIGNEVHRSMTIIKE